MASYSSFVAFEAFRLPRCISYKTVHHKSSDFTVNAYLVFTRIKPYPDKNLRLCHAFLILDVFRARMNFLKTIADKAKSAADSLESPSRTFSGIVFELRLNQRIR